MNRTTHLATRLATRLSMHGTPLRTTRLALLALAGVLSFGAGCAGTQTSAAPLVRTDAGVQWPVKTREHVDLWLHAYALLVDDTTTVPLFARGYRDEVTVAKNARNLYTGLDSSRAALATTLRARPELEGAQFVALYFGSWEEMRQAFDYFLKADGDPNKAGNREVQGIIAFLGLQFPKAEGREFARRLMSGVESERERFFHAWWVEQQRLRTPSLAAVDTLWQRKWRPLLQRYLNHTQQANGDLILSLPLGGEGRSVPAGKSASQYAVSWPRTADSAEVALFTFVHEAAGVIASSAVNDNLTPAQQREGAGTRLSSAGLVRGGALLMAHVGAAEAERYARYYLAQMGRTVPATGALAALEAAFPMPEEMLTSMRRQIEIAFAGI
ncbi:MAG: hypothetical protein OEW77_04450 [Gemmatimonadota bacterium]|nr:hypothetical protein [Gemmatimonadota bacterium]